MSKAYRSVVATLLIATFATLAGAAPSLAKPVHRRHAAQDPARAELGMRRLVVALLSGIFDFAGGAMDPNGIS
ncbi:MAG TPA: hypothetical protein VIE43_23495 [Thermoanaerobaculia bacterium]|jgi:hypothetical protein|nr:hypothetical protein [Thermoanaerobaculia bacterium]